MSGPGDQGRGSDAPSANENRASDAPGTADDASDPAHTQRETRVTLNKDFESFDAFVRDYVMNVSKTGVFVWRSDPLPVGTEVDLTFTVIMDAIETIQGVGQVVRVQQDPPGMGVVFTRIAQSSQQILERLLTRKP